MTETTQANEATDGQSQLTEVLERKITEAAEWFCDNPNCGDIEDALRELVAEAVSMGIESSAKIMEGEPYQSKVAADAIRARSNARNEGPAL